MTQRLRALAALPEVLSSIPCNHMVAHKVSSTKAQICASKVTYLGHILKKGKRWLSPAQKQTILDIPTSKTWRQVWRFSGFSWILQTLDTWIC